MGKAGRQRHGGLCFRQEGPVPINTAQYSGRKVRLERLGLRISRGGALVLVPPMGHGTSDFLGPRVFLGPSDFTIWEL